ncbi:hypothetical protein Goarm_003713, partial [Gossypium armourianum]|nr:hypothetical protein [Gossypium armourianum]
KWEKSPIDKVKINFDATIIKKKIGFGVLARDSEGFVMGESFKVERLQAEWDQIYALEESINVVNTLNIANAILKTGCASLANRIRNRRVDITIMGHCIDDLFNSNDMLHNAKFKWVNRNCNKATNFMN